MMRHVKAMYVLLAPRPYHFLEETQSEDVYIVADNLPVFTLKDVQSQSQFVHTQITDCGNILTDLYLP